MPPIRIGFIGLSKTGWASLAHVQFLISSPRFEIVAICNSSVQSSREAIELYKLPTETKAYGNPEDLAKDPHVELVVCSIRVDKHVAAISPCLRAGKNSLVEWPLGKNLAEAEELLSLSKEFGVKQTVAGLQGRFDPAVATLKRIISDGMIGKVLSSTWTGYAENTGPTVSEEYSYMLDRSFGGWMVTVHFGHSIDYIQQVLGKFKTAQAIIANQRPVVEILKKDGSVIKNVPKTTDDHVLLHGRVEGDAVVSCNLRGGKPFPDNPGLEWRIYGEKGEIRVTAAGPLFNIGYSDTKILVHDFASNEVIEAPLANDGFESFPQHARNVARLYDAFGKGDTALLCDFADAVERHRFIDMIYKQNGMMM